MYEEIKKLKEYCDKIGVINTFSEFMDGHSIKFNKGDVVQHYGTYGCKCGCVEFGYTDKKVDFKATTLKNAKAFVKRNKDYLNDIRR